MCAVRKRFVEPEPIENAAVDQATRLIGQNAQLKDESSWLAPLAVELLAFPLQLASGHDLDRLEADVRRALSVPAEATGNETRQLALLRTYLRLTGRGGKGAEPTRVITPEHSVLPFGSSVEGRAKARTQFAAHGLDIAAALASGLWPDNYGDPEQLAGSRAEQLRGAVPAEIEVPRVHQLMRELVTLEGLDLSTVVRGLETDGAPYTGSPLRSNEIERLKNEDLGAQTPRPTSLASWLIALGPDALMRLAGQFIEPRDDLQLARYAFGIKRHIEEWLEFVSMLKDQFDHVGPRLAEAVLPLFGQLDQRCSQLQTDEHRLLVVWRWFGRCVQFSDPKALGDGVRKRLLRSATDQFAKIRPVLSEAGAANNATRLATATRDIPHSSGGVSPEDKFLWEQDNLETCTVLMFELGGAWAGMKPMLLAVRALNAPCVAKDLRYWNESRSNTADRVPEDPPRPWSLLPLWLTNLFHRYAGREQERDVMLTQLRGEFAAFCLRGLADRWSEAERQEAEAKGRARTDNDMLERSSDWRYCLIRAAMALHINPDGKGHRLLHVAAELDPHPDVRTVANEAYQIIRRAKGLPTNMSPRRAVMTAFWWIRQAHLLSLGVEIDPNGAQRTRQKELTRTQEQEGIAPNF
jgi:hypothetical protein